MCQYRFKLLFFAFVLLLGLGNLSSTHAQTAKKLYINDQNITTTANATEFITSNKSIQSIDNQLFIIQFKELPSYADQQTLQQNGITLLQYIPDHAYYAHITNASAVQKQINNIYYISAVPSAWKIAPLLKASLEVANQESYCYIYTFKNVSQAALQQQLDKLGVSIIPSEYSPYHIFKVKVNAKNLDKIAQLADIQYINNDISIVDLDLQTRPLVRGNIPVPPLSLYGYTLSGKGVTVGVGDNGSAIFHPDTRDRVLNFHPGVRRNHGSHVNGIVGGIGMVDPMGIGMAPKVQLADFMYNQVLTATKDMYKTHKMNITNNSYALAVGNCSYSGVYDVFSSFLDSLSLAQPQVLHIFASGNDGYLTCDTFPKGYRTLTGGLQPAKNNLVVGSITNFVNEAHDESKGPTRDGRLKPEIVAVGLLAYSTIGIHEYVWAAGTSMASPQVAGGAALLTERYQQLHGGSLPPAALLKAILMNGAQDLGLKGPDFSYGFGALDVSRSLKIIDNQRFTYDSLANGASDTLVINVPNNIAQLKVLITWHDLPASPTASKQLINDLDLSVLSPSGAASYPLVPNGAASQVTATAVERIDHINNTEQVVINQPVTGNYSFVVKGYQVVGAPQHYALTYDLIPKGITLTHPSGGEHWKNDDTLRIFWNASPDTGSFNLYYSSNNGTTWQTLATNLPANTKYYPMINSGVNSGKYRIKITRNGSLDVSISNSFVINTPTVVAADSAAQCPGSAFIHWQPVPNASHYIVFRKIGSQIVPIDTVLASDTTYTVKGLSLTELSYIAVSPIIDGIEGYRSKALIYKANIGECSSVTAHGDLYLNKVLAPLGGRRFTNQSFNGNDTISLLINNLDNTTCTNYSVLYQLNSGAWRSIAGSTPLHPNTNNIIKVFPVDLRDTIAYSIKLAIRNQRFRDPNSSNDSAQIHIKHLANNPIALPYTDGFEDTSVQQLLSSAMGWSDNGHWDYYSPNQGTRLRTYVYDDITISGTRSVSLDAFQADSFSKSHQLVGTFNLSRYDTSRDEVRLDFDYMSHGLPKIPDSNVVKYRPNDTARWQNIYAFDFSKYAGSLQRSTSISLTDIFQRSRSNFTQGTQISFVQCDTSLIATPDYGNGITLDNVRLYTVVNDAQLLSIVQPSASSCGLPTQQSVIIRVKNGVPYTLYNVKVYYSINNGTPVMEQIDSITSKATIDYTFQQKMNVSLGETYQLSSWINLIGDSYALNDSVLHFPFRNNKVITNFPYLENFEQNDGGFYTGGLKTSWQYGQPADVMINKAASGTKAWKTNLTGNYNNIEKSYLYSPCFDIKHMSNPVLSVSMASDIEDCGGALCDKAYMEYTYDGINWTLLDNDAYKVNWYDTMFNAWTKNGFTRWHVSSIPLPRNKINYFQFRVAMETDPGATFEGVAIDDIHIYDLVDTIAQPSLAFSKVLNCPADTTTHFSTNQGSILKLSTGNQTISNVTASVYRNNMFYNPSMTQYTLGRNYTVQTADPLSDSVTYQLYVTDNEIVQCLQDKTCTSCTPLTDAYHLGITTYTNTNQPICENGTLADDVGGQTTYIPYNKITWIPFDKGYIARFKSKSLGEFWFNNGGPTAQIPATKDYISFLAYKQGNDIQTYWHSLIDSNVDNYIVERSVDDTTYSSVLDTIAIRRSSAQYSHLEPEEFPAVSKEYYRLKWKMLGDNRYYYSPKRLITDTDNESNLLSIIAQQVQNQLVKTQWTSNIDPMVSYYVCNRQWGTTPYSILDTIWAAQRIGQTYSRLDYLPMGIPSSSLIYYRLDAYGFSGTPLRSVQTSLRYMNNSEYIGNIYPNPVENGQCTITCYTQEGKEIHIDVKDMAGRSIDSFTAIAQNYFTSINLNTSKLERGIYMVTIVTDDKKQVSKLVIP